MRGKLPDMEGILQFCRERDITLVEDCAHVLGSKWRGKALGTLGLLGCYSTQTNKLINSGEGGFLVTSNEKLMARAVIHSGSYGHFYTHNACPEDEELMLEAHASVPNFSLRKVYVCVLLYLCIFVFVYLCICAFVHLWRQVYRNAQDDPSSCTPHLGPAAQG